MGWPLAILCYHRVLSEQERGDHGRPYFMRGTALTAQNFAAQLHSLVRRFDVLGERDVLQWLAGDHELPRPSCWITFDDGYRDVAITAAPLLRALDLAATAFLTTGVLDAPGQWLPADRWYATLNRSTIERGLLRVDGAPVFEFDLARDYARFVDGPERRTYLTAPPDRQDDLHAELARALGAADLPPAELYLNWNDVSHLAREGWSFGGHGSTHAVLTTVTESELVKEVAAPLDAFRGRAVPATLFAYPDGVCSPAIAAAVEAAGWTAAAILGHRSARRDDGRFSLARFVPSDDPTWVERVLLNNYRDDTSTSTHAR